MRARWLLLVVLAALLGAGLPAHAHASGSSLALDRAEYAVGAAIVATYATDRPDEANWIGVYTVPGNAPVDGVYVGPSTRWDYAAGSGGVVTIPTDGLAPGNYVAYYLFNDGYASLAAPVEFRISSQNAPRFLTDPVALANAAVGQQYRARLAGAAYDPDGSAVRYRKVAGPAWASVSPDGVVVGVPGGGDAGAAKLVVEARDADKLAARASVLIEVRPAGGQLVDKARIGSFNVWLSGTRVYDGPAKQARFVLESRTDVVTLSETSAAHTRGIADRVGWYSAHSGTDLGIVSKYPIVATFRPGGAGFGARVRLGGQDVVVFTTHLHWTPYGPYDACFDRMSNQQLLDRERSSGRVGEIQAVLTAMRPLLKAAANGGAPVFLTGDFNAPSHLDWTATAANLHCGYTVPWPVSRAVADAGLIDSYRVIHPNPVTNPGNTWSPVYPRHDGGTGVVEPQDRIDFIYAAGRARALDSEAVVYGRPTPVPNHVGNEWPSDHAAVVSTFRLS
jgi:endonuclease/exonuclease/phosphatase family metal-dependent hydrolase